jgi:hypothetical protein
VSSYKKYWGGATQANLLVCNKYCTVKKERLFAMKKQNIQLSTQTLKYETMKHDGQVIGNDMFQQQILCKFLQSSESYLWGTTFL